MLTEDQQITYDVCLYGPWFIIFGDPQLNTKKYGNEFE